MTTAVKNVTTVEKLHRAYEIALEEHNKWRNSDYYYAFERFAEYFTS